MKKKYFPMKPQQDNVLVEQVFTKIKRVIISAGDSNRDDDYEMEQRVLKLGDGCPNKGGDIKEGVEVVTRRYVEPVAVEQIFKDDNKIVIHAIFPFSAIVATK